MVASLINDQRIKAVSFVGSTPVAKNVYELSASSGKRCQALGGAKNHALILSDANIDFTTDQLISAAFEFIRSTLYGVVCCCCFFRY